MGDKARGRERVGVRVRTGSKPEGSRKEQGRCRGQGVCARGREGLEAQAGGWA